MAKLMNIYLNHFPKHEKYALSQQIRNCMYDLYSLMVEAQKRYYKKTTITNMDVRHEQLRMLVNLANNLDYFSFKSGTNDSTVKSEHRYLAISRKVDTIGKMIGGWIRAENNREELKNQKGVVREVS